jgi:hypothetical protein
MTRRGRNAFDKYPELVGLFGDLVDQAKRALLTLAAGSCLTAREAVSHSLRGLRERLEAAAGTEVERLRQQNRVGEKRPHSARAHALPWCSF